MMENGVGLEIEVKIEIEIENEIGSNPERIDTWGVRVGRRLD